VLDDHGRAMTISILARPEGLWTKVADFIPSGHKLIFKVAKGSHWTSDPDKASCSAEGQVRDATNLLVPWAPTGCLVGKVGGSTADNTAPPAAVAASAGAAPAVTAPALFVFAVGSFCMVQVPSAVSGPLFLTMNDSAANFGKHSGSVDLQIFEAP